jgi:ABC-type uncharacterized transport system ATPase subunit
MVFQSFALMPWLTVLENVELGLEAQGVGREERRHRAIEAIEKTGRSLNRGELLVQLNLDPIHWDRFRKELLSNGEVVQTGNGPGSRYTTSP